MSKKPQFDTSTNPYRSIYFVPLYATYSVNIKKVLVGQYNSLEAAMKARDEYEAGL